MKELLSVLALLLAVVFATAQTPKINYQAVVRDSHNRLVANTTIQVEVTVTYNGGTYSENLSGTTNANGLLSLEIGGDSNFNLIDWSTATIQTTAHLPGNETLQDEVNVTAVPFALYANHAADVNPAAIAQQIHDTATAIRTKYSPSPTNVSDLDNDAGYLTCDSSCIQNLYALISQLQQQVNSLQQQISTHTTNPTVTTTAVTNVTTTGATSGGEVTADGGSAVTARGVCWNTTGNPTITDSHTTDGSGTGAFTSSITELDCRTKYYVRAYATNAEGTSYGAQVEFSTDSVAPEVYTSGDQVIVTETTANLWASVEEDDCYAQITERGFYWGTSATSLNNHAQAAAGGTGEFSVDITGITANTQYWMCAYVTSIKGTFYSDTVNFTTANAPVTVTWNKSDIVNQGSSNSFTKDGVTITAGNIDRNSTNFMSGGTFTTTLGNFTKIEITGESLIEFSGTGWSGSNGKRTWEGTASNSVPFSGHIISMGGDYNFVFTIEANN